ncbi:preprotein translocase subunit TatA, partial [Candidatus Endoriftia persephone str. Guaymas]|nr:preprotein translocase subunit TatA [Candidatus Endoriftia persephone str. Guaymas]
IKGFKKSMSDGEKQAEADAEKREQISEDEKGTTIEGEVTSKKKEKV